MAGKHASCVEAFSWRESMRVLCGTIVMLGGKNIQAALDECQHGGAAHVAGGTFRSGPLTVAGTGVTL